MWMRHIAMAALLASAARAQDGGSAAAATFPVLDEGTFAQHWEHVVPTAAELEWRRIPWLAQLGEGVVAAQAADRPILLWAMNGHPLACT
jgi:hypothetical protein